MEFEANTLESREREMAAAKSHNRKIIYTFCALAVTSLVMAVVRL